MTGPGLLAQASPTGLVLERRTLESGRCHIPVSDDMPETEQPFSFRIESIAS
jgi:hypothetical protein